MTQRSDSLVEVTALQIAWSGRVSSNINTWPFGGFLLFFIILLDVKKVQISDAMFILLLKWLTLLSFKISRGYFVSRLRIHWQRFRGVECVMIIWHTDDSFRHVFFRKKPKFLFLHFKCFFSLTTNFHNTIIIGYWTKLNIFTKEYK